MIRDSRALAPIAIAVLVLVVLVIIWLFNPDLLPV
jgi:hypothetical protein